jgi:streptogramin lyase
MFRRDFFKAVAAIPAVAAVGLSRAHAATTNPLNVRTRNVSQFEVLYKTPHGNPNGLALTSNPDEMWIINQAPGSHASLIKISDGTLIREFETDSASPSGICVDEDDVMWITGTGNRLIVSCSPADGKTIAKYVAHGAGRIYEEEGDPSARASNLQPAYPRPPRRRPQPPTANDPNVGATTGQLHPSNETLPPGQVPIDMENPPGGTGSHGVISRGDLLYIASPPSRTIFTVAKKSWVVQNRFPTPGNRPHGITWADARRTRIWNADSNLNAFYLYDADSGRIIEKIHLPDNSPVIHGAKLVLTGPGVGYMYCCDDTGWMWRFRMPT